MLSRRDLIGKAVVGAGVVVAVGAVRTGVAATRPPRDATEAPTGGRHGEHATEGAAGGRDGASALESAMDPAGVAAPPPWALVAPFAAGAAVAHGWRLAELTPVQDGSAVVTLANERGHTSRVHLCRNDGSPEGLVATRRVDLVVMNQGYGELPTEEPLGQAVAALAQAVAANEATVPDQVFADLLPHRERVARFAAAEGPSADGKLR